MRQFTVKTPKGVLVAEVIEDEDYPGIRISLHGETVAIVEYDSRNRHIWTSAYAGDKDNLVALTAFHGEVIA